MSNNVVEMRAKAEAAATPARSMMWSMELGGGMGKSTTDLIKAVVQINLQATQELLRIESPADLLRLQQRFACDYVAALMRGTMALVNDASPV